MSTKKYQQSEGWINWNWQSNCLKLTNSYENGNSEINVVENKSDALASAQENKIELNSSLPEVSENMRKLIKDNNDFQQKISKKIHEK